MLLDFSSPYILTLTKTNEFRSNGTAYFLPPVDDHDREPVTDVGGFRRLLNAKSFQLTPTRTINYKGQVKKVIMLIPGSLLRNLMSKLFSTHQKGSFIQKF